ncbi:hypothetical protein TNCV_2364381 [Trichonephila clavipes]|nr:hypothetical protein TNCV_2364381 [Trichonephila clavipes]
MLRVTIDHDMASHVTKDPPPCLTIGRKQSSRSYASAGIIQTCTHPVVGKIEEDDSSDHIAFFHLSIDQVF